MIQETFPCLFLPIYHISSLQTSLLPVQSKLSKPGKLAGKNNKKPDKIKLLGTDSPPLLKSRMMTSPNPSTSTTRSMSSSNPHHSSDITNLINRWEPASPPAGSKVSQCEYRSINSPTKLSRGAAQSGKGVCSKGSYKGALLGFEQALQMVCRADILFREGRFEEALKEYEEAHRLDPHPEFHYKLSHCHMRLVVQYKLIFVFFWSFFFSFSCAVVSKI